MKKRATKTIKKVNKQIREAFKISATSNYAPGVRPCTRGSDTTCGMTYRMY